MDKEKWHMAVLIAASVINEKRNNHRISAEQIAAEALREAVLELVSNMIPTWEELSND